MPSPRWKRSKGIEKPRSRCLKITVHREKDLLRHVIKVIAIAHYPKRASITRNAIRRNVSSISIRRSNIAKGTGRCVAYRCSRSSSSNDGRETRNLSVFHSMNRVQQKRSVDAWESLGRVIRIPDLLCKDLSNSVFPEYPASRGKRTGVKRAKERRARKEERGRKIRSVESV